MDTEISLAAPARSGGKMGARIARELAVLLGLALLPALIAGAIQLKANREEPAENDEVSVAAIRAMGDRVQWVDARDRADFENEHIPGALLLNEDEWDALAGPFLAARDPAKKLVVYCGDDACEASYVIAERILSMLKLEHVQVLKGGLEAWKKNP